MVYNVPAPWSSCSIELNSSVSAALLMRRVLALTMLEVNDSQCYGESDVCEVTEERVVVVALHGSHLLPGLVPQQVLQAEPVGFLSDARVSLSSFSQIYFLVSN